MWRVGQLPDLPSHCPILVDSPAPGCGVPPAEDPWLTCGGAPGNNMLT